MKNKPDSWYRQSAVVPFRIIDKRTELLIINTRKKKWIFPKGIIETGLSAKESAVKEALEEAGVTGNLINENLGAFSYKKWGDKCKVKVYGMEVINLLDVWDESFRERKWIDIKEVEKYINKKEILKIVAKLEELLKNTI